MDSSQSTTETTPTKLAAEEKKSHKGLYLSTGVILGVLISLCLCLGFCGIAYASSFQSRDQKPNVEKVLDEFMKSMVEKNPQKAYELFSIRAKQNVSAADLEEMLRGKNFILFEGYQGTTVPSLALQSPLFAFGPSIPKGTIATAKGFVSYKGGYTGKIEANLEEESGEWKLLYINVTVPPEKLNSTP